MVAILFLGSWLIPGSPLGPEPLEAVTVSRHAGSNRYATAVEISKAQFKAGVPVVYISTGENFPDALAGGPVAAKHKGPILLVQRNGLPDVTRNELKRLAPGKIVILGGPNTVSGSVAGALGAHAPVSRLQGNDRYATAVAVSKAGFSARVPAVYISTGLNFPDALAASAAAARFGYPILLVRPNAIPDSVRAELTRLRPGKIFIAGGPAAVSETVRSALRTYTSGGVERVSGADRYATAAAISKRHFGSAKAIYLATGANYPDALAASPVAGLKGAPVLLTARTSLPTPIRTEILRVYPDRATLVGGTATISDSVASSVKTLLSGGGSRCPIPMPTNPPSGWKRAVTSSFNEVTPLGKWPGPIASQSWRNRPAGAKDSSGRGTYDSSKTVSEANGMLDIWIHSEVAGKPRVHDPNGQRYVAAIIPRMGHTHGARITICMRADVIPGYKIAYMLWPSEGPGNYHGEIDYPEMRLVGPPATANAFMHYAPKPSSGKKQDWYDSKVFLQDWHAYTIEWNPKASTPYAKFFIDGRLIGHSTKYVPTKTMQYIMQNETLVAGQALPAPAQGHVQIDWVTIDLP